MHIFLIDDDGITNMLNQYFFEEHFRDVTISAYTDPEDALDFLMNSKEQPNYIFLDINMPVMDGWEFLENYEKRKIDKEHKPDIYLLSSSVDPADFNRAKTKCYVKGFISKPLEIEKLGFMKK
ncbi:MAG TPA: response regulator [Flavobacteriales bacterium]|nr:response regulator [Flavobacteriales bacterium]HPH82053.1 response regulator [Flavobacteriales bacterium]